MLLEVFIKNPLPPENNVVILDVMALALQSFNHKNNVGWGGERGAAEWRDSTKKCKKCT